MQEMKNHRVLIRLTYKIHLKNILLWTICNHKNLVSIPSHLSCPLLPNVVNYSFWIILHLKIVYKYLGIFAFTLFLILHVLYSFPTNFLFWKTLNLWKIVRILIKFTFYTFHLVSPALNILLHLFSLYLLKMFHELFVSKLQTSWHFTPSTSTLSPKNKDILQ